MTANDDLYIIGETGSGVVKIGRSVNPQQRLAQLQTGYPRPLALLHVERGSGHLEPQLHERFASVRMSGEWFSLGTEPVATVLATIDGLRTRDVLEREYQDELRAAHAEVNRWREHVEVLETQIAIERAIFAKEQEMNELRLYVQQATAAAADRIAPELLQLVGGSSREEVDASVEHAIALTPVLAERVRAEVAWLTREVVEEQRGREAEIKSSRRNILRGLEDDAA